MTDEVMTAEQAAKYLQTSVYTVKRRARDGTIPAAKIGREWRFLRSELEKWLAGGGTRSRPDQQGKKPREVPETTPTIYGEVPLRDILRRLKSGLEKIYGDRLKGVYLYGSRARGDARPDSDVDIAVVLDDFESVTGEIDRTSVLVADLSLEANTALSAIPIREADWLSRQKPFIRSAREDEVAVT
ncbi:MAG: helix-turn-helix domain-containing protein [Armatimonadetes bacterium]|nr:helix-turn-helix domain-containing protein [Armatimonadota bacterium]